MKLKKQFEYYNESILAIIFKLKALNASAKCFGPKIFLF